MQVHDWRHSVSRRGGFTMIELLVAMTIFVLLAALAIPTFANLGVFSRNELQNTARELHSLLGAARIYSSTYRVDTAVVYSLDNFVSAELPNVGPLAEPVIDSVTNDTVRVIRAAAIMYQLREGPFQDYYVPVPRKQGDFKAFPGGMVVLLSDPDTLVPVYTSFEPRYNEDPGVNALGMNHTVEAILDGGPFALPGDPAFDNPVTAFFPAHLFTPAGQLDDGDGDMERYRILVAPSPDEDIDNRLIDLNDYRLSVDLDGNPVRNVLGIEIEIYRATGRIKVRT